MGQISNSFIGRAFFLSEARALEGKEILPRLVPPTAQTIAGDPTFFVDMFRVRIDPKKAENTEKMLVFNFTNGTNAGLHVRRGIAEFVPDPSKHYRPADISVTADPKTWAALYLNSTTIEEALKSGGLKMTKGSMDDLKAVMDLFDKFDPSRNYTIPMMDSDF